MQPTLTVDPGERFLRRDGEPWFLFGDTAWELFHRLGKADAEHYLSTRSRQGFNTILAVAISEFGGADVENAEGHLPLIDRYPARPNEPYWEHVDWIVARANDLQMTVGLLPCWGSYWSEEGELFATPERAHAYASWIANRYANADVIWVLGGDRNVETDLQRRTVKAFASAIRDVVGQTQLITYHARESSKDELGDAPWLDFDIVQSGHHGWCPPNYQLIDQHYRSSPRRPVIEGEPNYEGHPVMDPAWKPVPGWKFTDTDARRAAYHAAFAGAAGHVYGCDGIYQMSGTDQPDPITGAGTYWRESLTMTGAAQVAHCTRLLAELQFEVWEPRQDLVTARHGFRGGHALAFGRRDGTAVAVYAPWGRVVCLDLTELATAEPVARWWDPRAGGWHPGNESVHLGRVELAHPFPGADGVLVIGPAG